MKMILNRDQQKPSSRNWSFLTLRVPTLSTPLRRQRRTTRHVKFCIAGGILMYSPVLRWLLIRLGTKGESWIQVRKENQAGAWWGQSLPIHSKRLKYSTAMRRLILQTSAHTEQFQKAAGSFLARLLEVFHCRQSESICADGDDWGMYMPVRRLVLGLRRLLGFRSFYTPETPSGMYTRWSNLMQGSVASRLLPIATVVER